MNPPATDHTALAARAMGHWRAMVAVALLFLLLGVALFSSDNAALAAPGVLTPLSPETVGAASGTARVAVSPDGKNVYASNRFNKTVSQYQRNTTTGALTPLSTATVAAQSEPEGVVVSPDGKNVYVSNKSSEHRLAV